jgi:CheY-like chemotaxis protein
MRPTCVSSGPAAVSALQDADGGAESFGLLLLDGHMPETDGFETARRIRADTQWAGTMIMMLRSSALRGDRARCREQGVTHCLTKPICASALLNAIVYAVGPQDRPEDSPARTAVRAPDAAGHRPMRILVAEDNPVNQKLITKLLEDRGHTITSVQDGTEVLGALRDGAFDLVLMDVRMPKMNGLEATRRIRQSERQDGRGAHMPIVALTAHAMVEDHRRCLAAGMDGYLSKPVRIDELDAALRRVADGRAVMGTRAGSAGPAVAAAADCPLDARAALEVTQGNVQLLQELVGIFLEDLPAQRAALEAAVRAGEAEPLGEHAHALKGAAGSVGATRTRQLAARLEQLARDDQLDAAAEALAELNRELERLASHLQDPAWPEHVSGVMRKDQTGV